MKKVNKLFIIGMLFSLVQCKDDDLISPESHKYTSEIIIENTPPLLGGFTDSIGNLVSFNLPLVVDGSTYLSAKVSQYGESGAGQNLYNFNSKNFFYGTWSYDTFSNIYGAIPGGAIVDLASRGNNQFVLSYIRDSRLYMYSNGGMKYVDAINGITSIATNSTNELFVIKAPSYTRDGTLSTPPTLYKLDSSNNVVEYFKFSASSEYVHGGQIDSFPTDIRINLSFDKKDNLYICFGLDGVIYKLDNAKNLSVFRDDIFCPISLAFSKGNTPFVVSGPKFQKPSDDYELTKPVEVLKLSDTRDEVIYQIDNFKSVSGLSQIKNSLDYTNSGAHYNITTNHLDEIYLEDPVNCKIILIK
jgi:hypothetical protein